MTHASKDGAEAMKAPREVDAADPARVDDPGDPACLDDSGSTSADATRSPAEAETGASRELLFGGDHFADADFAEARSKERLSEAELSEPMNGSGRSKVSSPKHGSEKDNQKAALGSEPGETSGGSGESLTPSESSETTSAPAAQVALSADEPPAPSERDTKIAAFAAVFGTALVLLLIAIPLRGFLIDLNDPTGGVTPPERSQGPTRRPVVTPREPSTPRETEPLVRERRVNWRTELDDAPSSRPAVVLFVADYSSAARDLEEAVFEQEEVAALVRAHFTPYLVRLDEPPSDSGESDPPENRAQHTRRRLVELCNADFLPHICFLDLREESQISPSITRLVEPDVLVDVLDDVVEAYHF